VKQQLAAGRLLFDWLVIGQVMPTNPAASVRGPKYVVKTGKTPVLEGAEWRRQPSIRRRRHGCATIWGRQGTQPTSRGCCSGRCTTTASRAIDAITETDELALFRERAQRAQDLALVAEIAELARQEGGIATLGDPFLYPLPQRLAPLRHIPPCRSTKS